MKSAKSFSVKARINSFKYAFNGIVVLFSKENNAKVHLVAAILTIILACLLHVTTTEWILIIFCIGLVLSTEIINTCIEKICNHVSPQRHEQIKIIKDLAAAAVLISATTALIIGCIIFLPKLVP